MAQITWRNVGGGTGASANTQARNSATDTLMKAFDPLRDELSNRQAVAEEQVGIQTKANTQTGREMLQGYDNLGELNQAEQEGLLSETAFRGQFGDKYNQAAIDSAKTEKRQMLQNVARNEAIPAALSIADENQDIGAGLSELENKYRSMGMAEPQIQQELNSFRTNNSARVEGYEKANKKDADTFLTTVGTPKNPSQIEDIVAQAGEAGLKNTDYLRNRLTSELSATHEQEKYQRGANDYYKSQREEAAINDAMKQGTAMLQSGATPQEAFAKFKGNLTGTQLPQFLQAMSINDTNLSAMSNPQKEKYQRVVNKGAQGLISHQKELDKVDAQYVKQRENVTRITPAVLDIVDEANATPGGMVGKISDYMTKTGWEPSDLWSNKKTGKGKVETELNNFKAQIIAELPDATVKEVDAILWNSYQGTNKKSFFGATGLDVDLMRTSLTKNMDDFKRGELIDAERLDFKSKGAAEMETLTQGQLDYSFALKSSIETGNKTGKAGDRVDILKNIDKDVLTIPKDQGILGQRKIQLEIAEKAEKDRIVAEATAKLTAAKEEAETKKQKIAAEKETPTNRRKEALNKRANSYNPVPREFLAPTDISSNASLLRERAAALKNRSSSYK